MLFRRVNSFGRFQHTAARRRLALLSFQLSLVATVSTHSRPKAAGLPKTPAPSSTRCFNTQPPEGGWRYIFEFDLSNEVSTHSRPKAAGRHSSVWRRIVCFNTQPPEGGWPLTSPAIPILQSVSTHSRPKAAGICGRAFRLLFGCFNTQPPEGGWSGSFDKELPLAVSTHSRPKAAGFCRADGSICSDSFNTQPPEGGWMKSRPRSEAIGRFQHTAARRRLVV